VLVIEPIFAERAVFHAVCLAPSGKCVKEFSHQRSAYQREFARCYDEPDPDRRDDAFRTLHQRWFRTLGFDQMILGLIAEFGFVHQQVQRFVLAETRNRNNGGMELYGAPGRYTVVVGMAPQLLIDADTFRYWARGELTRIDDILDPAFDYSRDDRPNGPNPAAAALAHDRYVVLWAISVDARLAARGHAPADIRDRRRNELARAFGLNEYEKVEETFNRCWERFERQRPTHPELRSLAQDQSRLVPKPATPPVFSNPPPGLPCPLCGFPTFDWADLTLVASLQSILATEAPAWSPEHGLCGRCAEVFRAQRRTRTPAHAARG
jgi:hypothetical protein